MPNFVPLKFFIYNWSRKDIKPEKVISPPYDVLSPEDIKTLSRHDYNAVHIDSPVSYDRAREILNTWIRDNVLVPDAASRFYLLASDYVVEGRTMTRWGVLGGLKLEPFGRKVYPHEETYPKAKEDRLKLMQATQGQLSPVFGIYDDPGQTLEEIGDKILESQPLISFYQEDEVYNRIWPVPDQYNARIQNIMGHKKIFIADGHHRYETALHYMQSRSGRDDAPWKYIFIYLSNISSPGLEIFPYHRTVSNNRNFNWNDILSRAESVFNILPLDNPEFPDDLERTDALIVCLPERNYLLIPRNDEGDIFDNVGAYVLDKYLLREIIGLTDEELASGRYLHYAHDQEQIFEQVRSRELQAAFFLRPVPISIMQKACEAGRVMPRKSTFFYPKLPTGILFHLWER